MKFLGREKEILDLEKEYARDGGFDCNIRPQAYRKNNAYKAVYKE